MKKTKVTKIMSSVLTGVLALGMIAFTGCSVDSDPTTGTMQVKLHDAPANYDEVNIFIERVDVNNTTGDEGWETISEPNQSYDLLTLTNGVFEVIADTELEVGTYPQIRLVVSRDANTVVIDGTEHGLFVPSGAETGVKLNVNAEIREGIVYTLLLDFDALRSVVMTGQAQNPEYILKPVIRATNQAITGNIGGVIAPFEARAVVYALADGDTISTTHADVANGEFLLVGLEEGTYDVSVEPREEGFSGNRVDGVTVELDKTTDLGTIVLE
ncbi:MAG: DUF4382 domain-containing protein [Balneolales bacterium]